MPPRPIPTTSPDPLYARLGERVLSARRHMGMSQQQLAERVGLTRTSITNLEQGRQKIQVHTLYAIAAALGVGPETLLPALPDVSATLQERLGEPLHPDELDWVQRVVKPRRD
jgi:transcriptional regulator with XRE-family HTH domain